MKPVCVPCRMFFRPEKTGFYFIEGMPTEDGAKPGNAEPDKWKPYKVWVGDLWVCRGCGARILSGFGLRPIAEHFEPKFSQTVENLKATQLQVNDC